MEAGGKKPAKRATSADGEAAEKTRKKARKAAKAVEKAEEKAATPPAAVEPRLSKKERKAARAAEEGKADPATRQAATETFLAARESAKAQAQSEAQAAKAEKEARRAEREDRERQAKLAKTGVFTGPPSSSASYRELQRAAAVSGAPSADGNGSTEMLRGDWMCPGCGAMCFANRTACYKCGAAGGNARPGDWVCGPCGASVFACKESCYKCGAAKGTDGPGAAARPKKEWTPTVANGLQSNLKDTSATCRDCGAAFVVTAGEQDFFKSKGFDVCVPARCKPCTAAKKARYGDRYGAVPDATGRASTPDTGRCRNCGQDGHMAWACTAPKKSEACYHCGKQGHMSRACPDAKSATACFHCGKEGHISRSCPDAKGGGLQCFNCGKGGHLARDCTEARKGR